MLARGDTKVGGRFYETRCGPSRRGARNASAVVTTFDRQPEKTFSTVSARSGHLKRHVIGRIDRALVPPFNPDEGEVQ
jgi:hypothetical protein